LAVKETGFVILNTEEHFLPKAQSGISAKIYNFKSNRFYSFEIENWAYSKGLLKKNHHSVVRSAWKVLLFLILSEMMIPRIYAARFSRDSLVKIANSNQPPWVRISSLLILSDHYSSYFKDSALMYANQALELSNKTSNLRGVANSYYAFGQIYINAGNLAKARSYYLDGIHLCEMNKEIDGQIEGYMHISFFYQILGKNDSMMYYGLNALALSKKTDNIEIQAGAAHDVGNLYSLEGNNDKALYYCKLSLDTWKKIGHSNIAGVLSDIGNIYYYQKDYRNALIYYRQAYVNAGRNYDPAAFGYSLNNIGLVYYQLDSVEPAIEYFKKSISYYNLNMNKQGIANVEENLGKTYLKIKKYKEALDHSKISLEMFVFQDYKRGVEEAYATMAEGEAGLNDYKNAWLYQKLASQFLDSINRVNLNKANTDFETKMEIVRADNENNLLREEASRQKAELNKKNQFAFFISTVMILCLIIAFLALSSNRKRRNQLLLLSKLNEEIIQQKQTLEESDELKTKLFSIVSHDFKSPLASLQLFLSMFEEGDFTKEEVKELSGKLMERMNVTFSFIENLLSWAQSQLKGYTPNLSKIDLHKLVDENFELYNRQAEWKGIMFQNDINEDEILIADSDMLKLVLRNLMSNAIKYTGNGGYVTIYSVKSKNSITVSVSDTGVGMSQEMIGKIFSGQRVNTYGTFNEPGTGLGLRLCKEFLEKIGGAIRVKSELGKGSTFSFDIPFEV